MKIILAIIILVGFFLVLPMYTLNAVVLPQLQSYHQTYQRAMVQADSIANQTQPTYRR